MSQRQITMAAHLVGPAETETLMGREYRVLPAVLVRSQVLNNNLGATYLPPEEITDEWASAVNGAPVVVGDHPKQRGVHVSARRTDVLNGRGAGFLFRARAEDLELRADVFLDPERTAAVPDLEDVFNRVDGGEPVEVSTGFSVWIEERKGVANGEAYELVVHPTGFDHLAVFGGDALKGACSVEDGCGLGVNARASARRPGYSSTTEEDWSAPTLSDFEDGDATWADLSDERKQEIVETTLLGQVEDTYSASMVFPVVGPGGALNRNALNAVRSIAKGGRGGADVPEPAADSAYDMAGTLLEEEFDVEITENEETRSATKRVLDGLVGAAQRMGLWPVAGNESDEDRRRRIDQAVREKFGDMGDDLWIEAVFSEDGEVIFEVWDAEDSGYYRVSYEMDENDTVVLGDEPAEVRRVTRYEPVERAGTTQEEEGDEAMNRKEVIAQLSGTCPLSVSRLEELKDEELEELQTFATAANAGEGDGGEDPKEDPPKATPKEGKEEPEENPLTEVVENLLTKVEALEKTTAPAVEEQNRERTELVAELAANERVPFDEGDLEAKSCEELRKLRAMSRGVSYAARGVQQEPKREKELKYMPITPYWHDPNAAPEAGKEN